MEDKLETFVSTIKEPIQFEGGIFDTIKTDNGLTALWGPDITVFATEEGKGEEAFALKEGEDSWRRISRPKRKSREGWPKPFKDYTDEEMEQFLEDLKSKENMYLLCERRFRESGNNPFFVWVTIKDCFMRGFPLPRFVNDYLLRTAGGVLAIPEKREAQRGGKPKRISELLQAALGFDSSKTKGKDFFSMLDSGSRDRRIYCSVKFRRAAVFLEGEKNSLEDIFEIVGKKAYLSPESIKKIYQKEKKKIGG